MCDNNSCNGNICGCPDIVNDNLCCSVIVNNTLCLLPPAKGTVVVTFAPLLPANVTIIQNAGELCVCGLVTKIVRYRGVNLDGSVSAITINQDIPFHCCLCNCDFDEQDPSDYEVAAIEVENLCTRLSSKTTRIERTGPTPVVQDVYFCLKETDAVRVRLQKPAPADGAIPV